MSLLSTAVLTTEEGRQRAVTVALNLAHGTALEPQLYERTLLNQFVCGELTLDRMMELLEEQAPDPAGC